MKKVRKMLECKGCPYFGGSCTASFVERFENACEYSEDELDEYMFATVDLYDPEEDCVVIIDNVEVAVYPYGGRKETKGGAV